MNLLRGDCYTATRIREPVDKQQALVRRESVVNLENFKRQYARRRWKLSYSIVSFCNHLSRSLVKKVLIQDESLVGTFFKEEEERDILI
ncbi:Death-associated protein kinase 2 [Anas platyrhynchos]|uniref:Death-associated protein kinase 2 n=1 Tax=Anas platyrhynchos TaxID=8839 RepID=R0JEM9_ANAPL|nr:Death-associated protein kinase 2 [Anas platyrhynchos]